MPTHADRLPSKELSTFIKAQLERRSHLPNPVRSLGRAMKISDRQVGCYRDAELGGVHTDSFPRKTVEAALHRAGYGLQDVYEGELLEAILEPNPTFDRFCLNCMEITAHDERTGKCCWSTTHPKRAVSQPARRSKAGGTRSRKRQPAHREASRARHQQPETPGPSPDPSP
jgi:hypothetical protein